MKTLLLKWSIALSLMLPSFLFAQSTYHDDLRFPYWEITNSRGILADYDHNLITAGLLEKEEESRFFVSKNDPSGWPIWMHSFAYDDHRDFLFHDIEFAADWGYIISADVMTSSGVGPFSLFKLSTHGNVEWMKQYTCWEVGDPFSILCDSWRVRDVHPTLDGGFIVCGHAVMMDYSEAVFFMKTDANGNPQHVKSYKTANYLNFQSAIIEELSNGDYIALINKTILDKIVPTLVRLDQNLNVKWAKSFNNGNQYISTANMTIDFLNDRYYVLCYLEESAGENPQEVRQFMVMAVDGSGSELWNKTYYQGSQTSNSWLTPYEIILHEDGSLAIGGMDRTNLTNNTSDYFVLRTENNGTPTWMRYYETKEDVSGMLGMASGYDPNMGAYLAFTGQYAQPKGNDRLSTYKIPFGNGDGLCNSTDASIQTTTAEYTWTTLPLEAFAIDITAEEVIAEYKDIYYGLDRCGDTYFEYLDWGYYPMNETGEEVIESSTAFEEGLTIFPNPSRGSFTIEWDAECSNGMQVNIFDVAGRLLNSLQIGRDLNEVFFEDFEKGTYFVQLSNGKETFTKKIIVQ